MRARFRGEASGRKLQNEALAHTDQAAAGASFQVDVPERHPLRAPVRILEDIEAPRLHAGQARVEGRASCADLFKGCALRH